MSPAHDTQFPIKSATVAPVYVFPGVTIEAFSVIVGGPKGGGFGRPVPHAPKNL